MKGKTSLAKRREELSRIFKMALRQEKGAQKLYQRAITQCDDEDWKSLLAGLRADEARHEQELTELHKELNAFLELQEAASPGTTQKKAVTKRATGSRKKS